MNQIWFVSKSDAWIPFDQRTLLPDTVLPKHREHCFLAILTRNVLLPYRPLDPIVQHAMSNLEMNKSRFLLGWKLYGLTTWFRNVSIVWKHCIGEWGELGRGRSETTSWPTGRRKHLFFAYLRTEVVCAHITERLPFRVASCQDIEMESINRFFRSYTVILFAVYSVKRSVSPFSIECQWSLS